MGPCPARRENYRYDRDYVVILTDWTDEDPDTIYAKLKKQSGYYNFYKRTASDFFRDVANQGWATTISDRLDWGRMRMDPTDIADVTGYTYTFLVNGKPPAANWTALFKTGERVRLRFINGSAMTYFDVDNGAGAYKPRKHVINVKPGERLSFEVTADALGEWAFHCHLLYHMEAGMFRKVVVTQDAVAPG
ncbi:MAG: multicopper oxidase domain-containing protein [Chromatiales bacterium]